MPGGKREQGSRSAKRTSAIGKAWIGVRWIAGSPLRTLPREEIASSARLIGSLVDRLRRGFRPDTRFRVGDDRGFDLEATAFSHGISVEQLEGWLASRRRETARMAYLSFGLGWLFFFGWVYRAATMKWTLGHMLPAVEFAPFCMVFFLMAFRSALANYQIRMQRLASAKEYLFTAESFWPE